MPTTVVGIVAGVLAVGLLVMVWQLIRARAEAADLRWRLEQVQRQLAEARRTAPPVAPPLSDIERLSTAGEQLDPVAVSRAVWQIGRREARGAIRVLGKGARLAGRAGLSSSRANSDDA